MAGFDYIGSGAPTFGGPADAPAEYFDKVGRVLYVWDGTSGRWIPEPGTNAAYDGIAAAGTSQATATVLASNGTAFNVSTVASGTGVQLPSSWSGAEIAVNNNQAVNTLDIYPASGEKINALSTNAAYSAAVSTVTILYCFTAGQWFTK